MPYMRAVFSFVLLLMLNHFPFLFFNELEGNTKNIKIKSVCTVTIVTIPATNLILSDIGLDKH